MLLKVIKLTDQVARRTSGDARNGSNTPEVRPMAGNTGRGNSRTAGRGQHLALGNTALRPIGDELRTCIAVFELRGIHRRLDDALPDRFGPAVLDEHVEYPRDLRDRYGVGLHHLDIGRGLEC